MTRRYFGNAAHFIAADSCRFHLATQIGAFIISTVGDYHPNGSKNAEPRTIGLDRLFETMVFRMDGLCECGCGMPTHGGESIDFSAYQTRRDANAGHEAMCVKYENIAAPVAAEELAS